METKLKANMEVICGLSDILKREMLQDFGADFYDIDEPIDYDAYFQNDWMSQDDFEKLAKINSDYVIYEQ